MIAQAAGDRRHHGDQRGPTASAGTRLHRRASQHRLEIERQINESQPCAAKRANRSQSPTARTAGAEQVHRSIGARCPDWRRSNSIKNINAPACLQHIVLPPTICAASGRTAGSACESAYVIQRRQSVEFMRGARRERKPLRARNTATTTQRHMIANSQGQDATDRIIEARVGRPQTPLRLPAN